MATGLMTATQDIARMAILLYLVADDMQAKLSWTSQHMRAIV